MKLLLTTLLTATITFAQGQITPKHEGQHSPVTGKPFTGTEVRRSTQVLADGTRVEKSDSSTFYRDASGRARSQGKDMAVIFDPVGGAQYQLDFRNKTYTKTPIDAHAGTYSFAVIGDGVWSSHTTSSSTGTPGHSNMVHTRTVNGRQVTESKPVVEELQAQAHNGLYSRGKRTTTVIPQGAIGNDREVKVVNEQWTSDELQILVKSTNSDPRFGTTSYELTNVVQGPPDPALFQISSDFKERTAGHAQHQQHASHE